MRQAYIALGVLICAASEAGIDSGPMEGLNPAAVDETLNISKSGFKSVVACALGYRSEKDEIAKYPKFRRPLTETVTFI